MKKTNLILGVVVIASMMMTSFISSAQMSVIDINVPEEIKQAQFAADVEVTPVANKPLRFVMMIGMTNLPGDQVNPMCYSNVITLQGPPGWGEKGWLPAGSVEQAIQAIEKYKEEFCKACETSSGRKITRSGNFTYVWNKNEDGEELILMARAKNREDVTVNLR